MAKERLQPDPVEELRRAFVGQRFKTVLADPPWQFINRTGKVAPEHRRLSRYGTMTVDEICAVLSWRSSMLPTQGQSKRGCDGSSPERATIWSYSLGKA